MSNDCAPREKREALLTHHFAVENIHDLEAIMATFSEAGKMYYNHQPFLDADSIRQAHAYMGFSAEGAFADLETLAEPGASWAEPAN